MTRFRPVVVLAGLSALLVPFAVQANPQRSDMLAAFAAHCYRPLLTAQSAQANIAATGARVDFYDLNPFSDVAPTPRRDVTPGTDRRCEVAFDGDYAEQAEIGRAHV